MDAAELEQDAAWLDDGNPVLGIAFARPHARLGWLGRHRLIRENADPHLAATADVPGHCDSGRLDLTGCDPPRLERLNAIVAEVDGRPALCLAGPSTPLDLAVLDLFRHQHGSAVLREMRGLVMFAPGAALDLLLLGEKALELWVDRHDRAFLAGLVSCDRFGDLGRGRRRSGLALVSPTATAAGGNDPPRPGLAGGFPDRHRRLAADLFLSGCLVGQDVTLVDPDFDADSSEGGPGLPESVVDVGPQGVQRHTTLPVELSPGHFRTAEPSCALDPDPLGARLLHRL